MPLLLFLQFDCVWEQSWRTLRNGLSWVTRFQFLILMVPGLDSQYTQSQMADVCDFTQVVVEACDRVASGEYNINVLYVEQFGSWK